MRFLLGAIIALLLLLRASDARGAEPAVSERQLLTTFREEFVHITPGEGNFPKAFRMGSAAEEAKQEQPVHEVTIARPFAIAKYEVPQNLWEAVMGHNPSRWKGERNAVEMIFHAEAVEFCDKVTSLLREAKLIEVTETVRLPSEAEWEYAARAGTTTAYSFGDDAERLSEFAWHTGNAKGNDPPVGAKKANPWGLYDMHGYLWEWCADSWHENYTGAPADGSAWKAGDEEKRRVVRSGSWKDKAERLTSSFRQGMAGDTRDDAVGLRCVLASTKGEKLRERGGE